MAGEGGSVTLYATMNEEQLRAELAKRDDDFANASDSRDRWKHRAQSLDEERDAFRDLVVGFAEDVERLSRLSDADVASMRTDYATGAFTRSALALKYGTVRPTVASIVTMKSRVA